ncbi:hypothetical protein [Parafrankia sp. BMG5.11]|uniref:hypothetical protein n=1 Tax=Parafrankia sp. BMG5.11 TaxID=222540 RepID=UPI0010403C1A|nr:hypothetical protein [Parafrankia sp. BMG5.11]TCJ40707.1 hypothetical protein E0504_03775 [Parafrankia sp. BMG5.11]
MKPAGRIERALAAALPIVLGAAVFAVAFDHVRAVATWAGQPGWYSVVIASTGEIMAVASILEIRARRASGEPARWPVLVLVASIAWSGACNLRSAAGLHADPGAWRFVMALWVVLAFGLVAGIKATRGAHRDATAEPPTERAPEHLAERTAPNTTEAVEEPPAPVQDTAPDQHGAGPTERTAPRIEAASKKRPAARSKATTGARSKARRPRRTDAELTAAIEALDDATRDSVRGTATALGIGQTRARRLLAERAARRAPLSLVKEGASA